MWKTFFEENFWKFFKKMLVKNKSARRRICFENEFKIRNLIFIISIQR